MSLLFSVVDIATLTSPTFFYSKKHIKPSAFQCSSGGGEIHRCRTFRGVKWSLAAFLLQFRDLYNSKGDGVSEGRY
jgi:hypothetical protein